MMKSIVVSAVVTAALTLSAQASQNNPMMSAQSGMSGYVGVYGGGGWSTNDQAGPEYKDSFGVFGGNAAVNYWLGSGSSVQMDLNGQATTDLPNCCGGGAFYGSIGGHWSMRNDQNLWGIFGGLSGTNVLDESDGANTQGVIGAEAQAYLGNWTLYGQTGYIGALQANTDYSANLWFGRFVARVFLTPMSKLQGEIGYASGKYTGDDDPAHFLNWGVSWEQQLSTKPISAFVSYSGVHADGDPDGWSLPSKQQVVAGLKFNFGQSTLMDQDRKGATLDMPNGLLADQTWDELLY